MFKKPGESGSKSTENRFSAISRKVIVATTQTIGVLESARQKPYTEINFDFLAPLF